MTQVLKKETNELLNFVEKIADNVQCTQISAEFRFENSNEISAVSGFLEISEIQAVLFCIVLKLNFGNNSVNLNEIAAYVGCNPFSILGYHVDFEVLINKKIFCRYENPRRRHKVSGFSYNFKEFYVTREVIDSLRIGIPVKSSDDDIHDVYALMTSLSGIYNDFNEGEIDYSELMNEVLTKLSLSVSIPFVKELEKFELEDEDILLFILLCTEFIEDGDPVNLLMIVRCLYSDIGNRMRIRKQFLMGTHDLIKLNLVKLEEGDFQSEKMVTLTETGILLLFQGDANFVESKVDKNKGSIIQCDTIVPKELYFNGKETKSLSFLTDILKPDNHCNLVQRMMDAGMKTGVAALLYGPPGTGKTESVYQLARATGRDIQMISISETKSMWFGESEKLIKKIFDEYRQKVERSKIAPILLFNEADGIYSSRKTNGSSAVDQTQNAIQNIILQEMEDLKGILIATTNLTQNLDPAFERRFLYKICFEKPDAEARIKIWLDKVKNLPMDSAKQLSQTFDLSGGQIENVARKCLMQQLLYGAFPDLNEILTFCTEEQIATPVGLQKIGFVREVKAVNLLVAD
jgi:hypothetical protein